MANLIRHRTKFMAIDGLVEWKRQAHIAAGCKEFEGEKMNKWVSPWSANEVLGCDIDYHVRG